MKTLRSGEPAGDRDGCAPGNNAREAPRHMREAQQEMGPIDPDTTASEKFVFPYSM